MEIELPDGTVLDAPDDADPSAVAKAYLSKQKQPQAAAPAEPQLTFLDRVRATLQDIPRQAQLAARIPYEVATGIPGLAADAVTDLGNRITGKTPWTALTIPGEVASQLPSRQLADATINKVLPQPETTQERVANFGMNVVGGLKMPNLQIGPQVPKGFTPPAPALTQTQQTLKAGQDLGYVVPPATANPSAFNVALESVGGKAATQQAASLRNQTVTNQIASAALGLGKDAKLTPEVLKSVRDGAGKVYGEIAKAGRISTDPQFATDLQGITATASKIAADFPDANVAGTEQIQKLVQSLARKDFDAKSALEYLKQLRAEASSNLSFQNAADPAKRALGTAQRDGAAALEDQILRHLVAQGKNELAQQFDEARTLIAKSYTIEKALNPGTGNVAARNLAGQIKKGKPLSGDLANAARFASAFPKASDEVLTSPGVSALDAALTGGGALGLSAAGSGLAPLALAWPGARLAARYGALTGPMQRGLIPQANPPFAPPPEAANAALYGLLATQ